MSSAEQHRDADAMRLQLLPAGQRHLDAPRVS